ncbi:MAG: TRAP transporter TatT component family protein [Deltaproteobacteria bacterium]|nr:TRAP transporter TatT component family protein [Deltaproteobacteria bacterium]
MLKIIDHWRVFFMRHGRLVAVLFALSFLSPGCASLVIPPMVGPVVKNLNRQADLELVCDGAPSYLLLLDSLLVSDPDNARLLLHGTQAYTAYASLMPECGRPERAAVLGEMAKAYGLRLLGTHKGLGGADQLPLAQFSEAVQSVGSGEVDKLFWGGYGWATWIGFSKGAPAAVVDLPKVEQLMLRVLALDERFYQGGAHLFLGIYNGSRPAMLGGRPEVSREHFEKALALGERRFLPALVAYAEYYAKQTFDRELYVSLLEEALAFDLALAPDLTLPNVLAKRRAQKLLAQADEIF